MSSSHTLHDRPNGGGFFVVILGPDGAGKSTVCDLLLRKAGGDFSETWRFHWRPGLLPQLRRSQGTSGESGESQAPPETSRYRGIVSLVRFFYYWLDFVIGYWAIIYPRKMKKTLVVGERYFPDVLVHPERYGFAVPRWLMRVAAGFVPGPDLLVLLKDEPERIFARKPELSPATIAKKIEAYEDELTRWRDTAVILTTGGAETVAGEIADIISGKRAALAKRRMARLQ